jgi:hypothetical protein
MTLRDRIGFGWAFTVNHAHLVPEGIGGFLDALFDRLESAGYTKHYSMAFGGDDTKLAARDRLAPLR